MATAHLRLGRIWSGMERESSETRSPSTIRSLDLPPFYFFQGFRLAKSGLMRAAFTCHHHHIHKSSCCFPTSVSEVLNFPSPSSTSPLKVQRAWDQVRMPLWFSPPPLWLPFYVRGHFVFGSPPSLISLPSPDLSLCSC